VGSTQFDGGADCATGALGGAGVGAVFCGVAIWDALVGKLTGALVGAITGALGAHAASNKTSPAKTKREFI